MIDVRKREVIDPNMFIEVHIPNLWEHNNIEKKHISDLDIFNWSHTSITGSKMTENDFMQKAYRCTSAGKKDFIISDYFAYESGHSPERTQWYFIEMENIPNFASVHFVRHDKFAYHFDPYVMTGREDRDGLGFAENRYSSKNHSMMINAAELKTMAWSRLCQKAHADVRYLMCCIREIVYEFEPELAKKMVPYCVANGKCKEANLSCKQISLMHERYAKEYFENIKSFCLPTNRDKYFPKK